MMQQSPRWIVSVYVFSLGAMFVSAYAAEPASRPSTPADPTVDWLLSQATTAPASPAAEVPRTQPSALQSTADEGVEERPAEVTLSNKEKVAGDLSTTLDQPVRVWVEEKEQYRDVPYSLIKTLEAHVAWERDEKEWKFKESGSDIKEYSGKTYPARETTYTLTLKSGEAVTGSVNAPLYLKLPHGGQHIFVLHKRDKGDAGATLKDLVYVQKVEFKD